MEIEKKYRIKTMPDLEGSVVKEVEQGYLCIDPVVRIRRSNDRYILTYKGRDGQQSQKEEAQICQEVELPLTRDAYQRLSGKIDGYLIQKTRYVLPLEDGHNAELDVFHGRLQGLVLVEVEFADLEDMKQFCPPDWFGENVSGDSRYCNCYLAQQEDMTGFTSV